MGTLETAWILGTAFPASRLVWTGIDERLEWKAGTKATSRVRENKPQTRSHAGRDARHLASLSRSFSPECKLLEGREKKAKSREAERRSEDVLCDILGESGAGIQPCLARQILTWNNTVPVRVFPMLASERLFTNIGRSLTCAVRADSPEPML